MSKPHERWAKAVAQTTAEHAEVTEMMALWGMLGRARRGEPLAAGEGAAICRHYETLLAETRAHEAARCRELLAGAKQAHEQALAQAERIMRRRAAYAIEAADQRARQFQQTVRRLAGMWARQFGAWHTVGRWAELHADRQIHEVLQPFDPSAL
jgi:hypothetical protein